MIDYSEFKQLIDPDVKKKTYDEIIGRIESSVDVIWRYICQKAEIKMKWYVFSNFRGEDDAGYFDPHLYNDFIFLSGSFGYNNNPFFKFNEGFPTSLIWTDNWKQIVDDHIKEADRLYNNKQNKKTVNKIALKQEVNDLKSKLKSTLTERELSLIYFKKV